MKAERRHELRENDLVHALHSTRDYLKNHGERVGGIAAVVIILVGVVSFSMRSKASTMDSVWRQRADLDFTDLEVGRQSLDQLRDLTIDVSSSRFVMDSLMVQGGQALQLAQLAPAPPDPALNERAREAFETLRDKFSSNSVATGVALLGLATVEENAFVLDRSPTHKQKAHDYLSSVIRDERFNGLPLQTVATQRREALDRTFTMINVVSAAIVEAPAPTDEADDAETP